MSALKPISILLAEDNEDHAEIIIDSFQETNQLNSIERVADGEAAIQRIQDLFSGINDQENLPDLVLLDINMPKMGGLEALKIIKQDPNSKQIPVIMISTSSTAQEIRHCFELGANSYITKPVQFDEFYRKIKDLNFYWSTTTEIPSAVE